MFDIFLVIGASVSALSAITAIYTFTNIKKVKDFEAEEKKSLENRFSVATNVRNDTAQLIRLQQLNKLYMCGHCERYTRQHMMKLNNLKVYLETGVEWLSHKCPNCGEHRLYEAEEKYKWMTNHRHCYRLTEEQYPEFQRSIDTVRQNIEYVKEMKSFEEYEMKHLANGPRDSEEYFFGGNRFVLSKQDPEKPDNKWELSDVSRISEAWKEMGVDLDTYAEIQIEGLKERKEFRDYIDGNTGRREAIK